MLTKELLYPALATIISILVYFSQSIFVSAGRSKYDVRLPKTTGHNDNFDRIWRVHYNTLEQMPIYLPLLWIFSLTVSPFYSFILGILWSVGRIGYMVGYYKSVEGRHNPVAAISSIVLLIFLICSLWSIIGGLIV
ncbi:MAG: MAPEG family protein [candidate division SR1 bacterium]|nr:MAPEG family protein [candidate division SR1 bacterium]